MIKKSIVLMLALSISLFGDLNKYELDKLKIGALIVKDLNTKNILYSKFAKKKSSSSELNKNHDSYTSNTTCRYEQICNNN